MKMSRNLESGLSKGGNVFCLFSSGVGRGDLISAVGPLDLLNCEQGEIWDGSFTNGAGVSNLTNRGWRSDLKVN